MEPTRCPVCDSNKVKQRPTYSVWVCFNGHVWHYKNNKIVLGYLQNEEEEETSSDSEDHKENVFDTYGF